MGTQVRNSQRERQRKMFEEQEAKKKEMQRYVDKHLHKGTPTLTPPAPTSAPGTGLGSPLPHLPRDWVGLAASTSALGPGSAPPASTSAPGLGLPCRAGTGRRAPARVRRPRGAAQLAALPALFSAPCRARVCVCVCLCVCVCVCLFALLRRELVARRLPSPTALASHTHARAHTRAHSRAHSRAPSRARTARATVLQVKQAQKVEKQMNRIGALGQDGKKWKLSYDGPQQVRAIAAPSHARSV